MSFVPPGASVHGEFSSADASALTEANSRFTLYGQGSTSTLTLAATEIATVTHLIVTAGAALTATVYDGADNTVGGGEVVAKVTFAAAGSQIVPFSLPHYCQVGTYPKVKTSGAGQIDVRLGGTIVKQGGS